MFGLRKFIEVLGILKKILNDAVIIVVDDDHKRTI